MKLRCQRHKGQAAIRHYLYLCKPSFNLRFKFYCWLTTVMLIQILFAIVQISGGVVVTRHLPTTGHPLRLHWRWRHAVTNLLSIIIGAEELVMGLRGNTWSPASPGPDSPSDNLMMPATISNQGIWSWSGDAPESAVFSKALQIRGNICTKN